MKKIVPKLSSIVLVSSFILFGLILIYSFSGSPNGEEINTYMSMYHVNAKHAVRDLWKGNIVSAEVGLKIVKCIHITIPIFFTSFFIFLVKGVNPK